MPLSRRQFLTASTAAGAAAACTALPRFAIAQPDFPTRRIAQMILVGFDGSKASDWAAKEMASYIAMGFVGGVCFIAKNATHRPGVVGLTKMFHEAAKPHWPLLVAIDQEGGHVQRLSSKLGYGFLPSPAKVALTRTSEEARGGFHAMARAMRETGFNLNLAPVVDLGFEPRNVLITQKGRTFGKDSASVVRYSREFVLGHRNEGMLTALKHFPGHGSALRDSHEGAVDITATWRGEELTPYRRMFSQGLADMVMTGHMSHKFLTEGLPATLSRIAVTRVLREQLKYDGVVITDDLDMRAVSRKFPRSEAVIRAVAAGHDLVLATNDDGDRNLPMNMIAAIQKGIRDGRISAEQVEASVRRIERLKATLARPAVARVGGRV